MSAVSRPVLTVTALSVVASISFASPAQASTEWTYFVDAPGVQSTYIQGAVLEDFEDGCASLWAMGAVTTGTCSSVIGDAYGGASTTTSSPTFGGVASKYGAFGPNHPNNVPGITIELDAPAEYFGIWWTAGDRCNSIEFYSEGTLTDTFEFDRLMDLLDSGSLNGISGTDYSAGEYYGSPVNYLYQAEPFAYLHAFAPNGETFDEIRLMHEPTCGGFEFDNVAVASEVQTDDVDSRLVPLQENDAADSGESLAQTGSANLLAVLGGALVMVVIGLISRRRLVGFESLRG
jgi:LPXTG-motif cell wall-anchored protein